MNATKSLVTGAVALTAFASVLGLAYAQVENTAESAPTQATQEQYPATQTEQQAPADQSMTPADQSNTATTQQNQTTPEAQSQPSRPAPARRLRAPTATDR